ncbi:MAG: DUF2721 domain-containing protein [Cyclonatronaceae bacterium]
MDLTTPALLFPAISLLLLAYTNRFLTIAGLIRKLHDQHKTAPHPVIAGQIDNLRKRLTMIKNMQLHGVGSLFLCVLCMFLLFAGEILAGKLIFAISLVMLLYSLWLSIREIYISVNALDLQLSEMQN